MSTEESTEETIVTTETEAAEEVVAQPRALFFELENVAFPGHEVEFKTLSAALKQKKITLSIPLYSRYCVSVPPGAYMAGLMAACSKDGAAVDKLASDVSSKLATALAGATPNAAVAESLKAALANGVKLGAVSGLEPAAAKKLIEKLGLSETDVVLHAGDGNSDTSSNGPEVWSHRARSLKVSPRACVLIGSHARVCRAAIAAQMQCVALTNSYTEYEDFGGADHVTDELDASVVADMLSPDDS